MKRSVVVILLLIFAGAVIAGCIDGFTPDTNSLGGPQETSAITDTPKIPVPQPSFSMGSHYLKKSYSFQSEKDVFVEEVRVDNASWGIGFDVLSLTDDVIYSWFEMKITNVYTNQTEMYGYGRTNGFELKRLIPMYNTGLYKFEMRGNRVKVDVTVAKRNP
jgi:predicted small secreted protein